MSKVQMLRCLVNQRLTAAAEDIFGLFERTIAEHEEERSALKEENERQRKLLDAVFNPQLRLHRAEDPEPPHSKEEQEELWTSQEGEQLQGLEEADDKFSFTPVKIEDDEEEAQSSELHLNKRTEQMETEADGEDCGGPEPDRNSDPDSSDIDDSDDWKETREPQLGLNSLKPDEVHVSDSRCSAGEKLFTCSECGKIFRRSGDLKIHMTIHTGEKPYSCSVCNTSFNQGSTLKRHMRIHTEEKPYSCSVCKESFNRGSTLQRHMRIHTGEKPFSCSVCKESFNQGSTLKRHMTIHTGEKPYSCSVCKESFNRGSTLKRHKSALKLHMNTHTRDNWL